jgi:ribonuclease HI
MEILAVISALHHCKAGDTVTIYSDSAYVINCMNQGWYKSWERNGVNSQGKIPANLDLWHMLLRATNRMSKVTWIHIKGHNGNKFNELCDELAGKLTSSKNRADIYYEY